MAFDGLSIFFGVPIVDCNHRNGEHRFNTDPKMGSFKSKCVKNATVKNKPSEPLETDLAFEVSEVGASRRPKSSMVNPELKEAIEKGRKEIRDAQEKLNSSLTTPIVDSEARVKFISHFKNAREGTSIYHVVRECQNFGQYCPPPNLATWWFEHAPLANI